jgi:uncharacterized metal-binding protein
MVTIVISVIMSLFFDYSWTKNNFLIYLNAFSAMAYLFFYSWSDNENISSNVKTNSMVAPIIFIIVLVTLYSKMSLFDVKLPFTGALFASIIFLSIYLFSNEYFQPDLDLMGMRPGHSHFPFGRKASGILRGLNQPLAYAWHIFWKPYGNLLTHRGAGHMPILSVWLRVSYVYFWYFLFKSILGIKLIWLETWLKMFFPWGRGFGSIYFFILCFPIYLVDFIHISVDYLDSVKKGISFCPKKIPRGIISQFLSNFKD